MNANMAVSVRSLVLTGLVVASLVGAYLLGEAGGGGAAARAADDATSTAVPEAGQVTMAGTGRAGAVPDQLSFAVAVHLTRPELDDALDAANQTMSRVLAAVAEHGVEKSDVQTTGLSMTPVYDYHPYDPPTLRGYRVTERTTVHVDELRDGGGAVSAAVAAGGNDVRVDDLRLLVGDTDEVMEQARTAAIEEARAKAEQYAGASGQELGEVRTISEVGTKPPPTPVAQTAALDASRAVRALPVRAGRDQASVTVRVVWELE